MNLLRIMLLTFGAWMTLAGPAPAEVNEKLRHPSLLPKNTVAAISVIDPAGWNRDWPDTGLARYLGNREVGEFYQQLLDQAASKNLLLSFAAQVAIPDQSMAEVTFAVVEQSDQPCWLMLSEFNEEKIAAEIQKQAAEFAGKNGLRAPRLDLAGHKVLAIAGESNLFCLHTGKRFLASSSFELLQQTIDQTSRLVEADAFSQSVAVSLQRSPESTFWWFANPMMILKHSEGADSGAARYELAKAEGMDAIKSIGGAGRLGATPTLTGQILARRPFQRSMRLLDLESREEPASIGVMSKAPSGGFLNLRLDQFTENFSTLFDATAGEGEAGVFQAVLDDMKSDPQGPQLDVNRELFAKLKPPVWLATNIASDQPQTTIVVDSREDLTRSLSKMFEGDSRASRIPEKLYPSYRVLPLEDNPAGLNQPFVVALHRGRLAIAPDSASAESTWAGAKGLPSPFGKLKSDFGYFADLGKISAFRHEQIRRGEVAGFPGWLIRQMKMQQAIQQADRSKLPSATGALKFPNSQLHVRGIRNDQGWELVFRFTSR